MTIAKFLAGAVLLLGSHSLSAGIIKADFGESLDLPSFQSSGPRIVGLTAVLLPSAGPQLTAANEIANPTGWSNMLNVTFDAATNILSLTADGENSYQIITVTLSNLGFNPAQHVTGFSPVSVGNAVVNGSSDEGGEGGQPVLQTSFTANSITVSYVVSGGVVDNLTTFKITDKGIDTFQLTLGADSTAVPEPGTIGLAVLGLLMVWPLRRLRK